MIDLTGQVAVVTGGASGIGFSLCKRLGERGARVVMTDIEQTKLDESVAALTDAGLDVTGMQVDVTDAQGMSDLAVAVARDVGPVRVLCNNAGVGIKEAQRRLWTLTPNDWRWGLEVNVMGIANGIRAFVPAMLEHGMPGHVVNTSSSNGGITSLPTTPIYSATKAAVTSLTEVLHYQFLQESAALRAHVLFPGPYLVNTNILNSGRNRPQTLRDGEEAAGYVSMADLAKASGVGFKLTEPDEVADSCLAGIDAGEFWIFPATRGQKAQLKRRTDDILERRNPVLPE